MFTCGFEAPHVVGGFPQWCNMWQADDDELQWNESPANGKTPTERTGPRVPFQGRKFAYMEASSPAKTGDKARYIGDLQSKTHHVLYSYVYNEC